MTYWNAHNVLYNNAASHTELQNFTGVLHRINNSFFSILDDANGSLDASKYWVNSKDVINNPYALYLTGDKNAKQAASFLKNMEGKQTTGEDDFTHTGNAELPSNYSFSQNYPNPFNPATTISFLVETHSYVSLRVYDVLGQEVATLINNEQLEAGTHSVEFNASALSSGVYFYRLNVNNGAFVQTRKLVLMK